MSIYEFILAFISGGALMAIIEIVRSIVEKKSAKTTALQFLLLRYVREEATDLIRRGSIKPEGLKRWLEMYQTYKRLGGNGYADELKDKIARLPLDLGEGGEYED